MTTPTATLEKTAQYPAISPVVRCRPWWHTLGETLLILLLLSASLEYLFAAAGLGEQEFLKRDPLVGFVPMPGKRVSWRKEGFSRTQYNSFGMPERQIALDKPQNTFRIAVIGDSMVESLQVDRDASFLRLVEKSLNETGGAKKFEVLNFGVSSYNLGQMYLRLKYLVCRFHPDLVLLCVRPNCVFDLFPKPNAGFFFARPYFFLGDRGRLVQDYTVQALWNKSGEARRLRATEWLRQNSRIWGVVSSAMEAAAAWYMQLSSGAVKWGAAVTNKQTAFAPASATAKQAPAPARVSPGQASPVEERAVNYYFPIAERLIAEMNGVARANASQLAIVRLPSDYKPNNPETALLRQTAACRQIAFLDTTESFEKSAQFAGKRLFYVKHFTPAGHSLLADNLLPFLSSMPSVKAFRQSAPDLPGRGMGASGK